MAEEKKQSVISSLFGSKKFVGFLVGIALQIAVATGWVNIPEELQAKVLDWVFALTGIYVGAQGVADIGKEKAKIEKGIS